MLTRKITNERAQKDANTTAVIALYFCYLSIIQVALVLNVFHKPSIYNHPIHACENSPETTPYDCATQLL